MSEIDEHFFDRADEHIELSNKQISASSIGEVSASMMYSTARFNTWVNATNFKNSTDMNKAKAETIQYFVTQYEKMLKENLEDYIQNFNLYMKS